MTMKALFFDSVDGDRVYTADAWADVFAAITSEGVVPLLDEMEVVEDDLPSMTIKISLGMLFIQGKYFEVHTNPETVDIPDSDPVNPRIDRVVARLDANARTITLEVVQGVADPAPVAPALTRTVAVYEMSLARVYVRAAATAVKSVDDTIQAYIIDERSDEAVCGFSGPLKVELAELFDVDLSAAVEGETIVLGPGGVWVNAERELATLSDVDVSAAVEGDALVLGPGGVWVPGEAASGAVFENYVATGAANTWLNKAALPSPARSNHAQCTLSDGRVLVAGGNSGSLMSQVDVYDPVANTWTNKASLPAPARSELAMSELSNGRALVTGGWNGSTRITQVDMYDINTNAWTNKASLPSPARGDHAQSTLSDGRVLVSGGFSTAPMSQVDVYDPVANTWTNKASLPSPARYNHGQSSLSNGRVLVTGTYNGSAYTTQVDMYDINTNAWTNKAALPSPARGGHGQSTLSDGRVLVSGGYDGANYMSQVDVYDPVANTWTNKASLPAPARYLIGQSTLSDGKVIVTGGSDGTHRTQVDVYNIQSNSFLTLLSPAIMTMITVGRKLINTTKGISGQTIGGNTGDTIATDFAGSIDIVRTGGD